jgi:hypothetical protein
MNALLINTVRAGTQTPWGPADIISPFVPQGRGTPVDAVAVSTASHGGVLVSREEFALWPQPLRECGEGIIDQHGHWFEEDEAWVLPVLAYAPLRERRWVAAAVLHMRDNAEREFLDPRWVNRALLKGWRAFQATDCGKRAEQDADSWLDGMRGYYQRGGSSSHDGIIDQHWTPVRPDERAVKGSEITITTPYAFEQPFGFHTRAELEGFKILHAAQVVNEALGRTRDVPKGGHRLANDIEAFDERLGRAGR